MRTARLAHGQPLVLALVLVLSTRSVAQEPPPVQFGTPAASTRPILLGPVAPGSADSDVIALPLPPGAARLLTPLPLATGLLPQEESEENLRARVTALERENRELLEALQSIRPSDGSLTIIGVTAQDASPPSISWPPAPEATLPTAKSLPLARPLPTTAAPAGPRYQIVEGIEYQAAEHYVWCAVPEAASCGCSSMPRPLRWLTSWWPFNRERCGACARRRWVLRRKVQRVPVTVYYRVPCAAPATAEAVPASPQSDMPLPPINETPELSTPRPLR